MDFSCSFQRHFIKTSSMNEGGQPYLFSSEYNKQKIVISSISLDANQESCCLRLSSYGTGQQYVMITKELVTSSKVTSV